LAAALAAVAVVAPCWAADAEPLGLTKRSGIKVVYQIKTDAWKNGVGSGLHYVSKLVNAYDELGIRREDRAIHAVLHGDAGYWMLTDEAYAAYTGKPGPNPNRQLIDDLAAAGVHLELCAQTMASHGWKPENILPDITVVVGAYPRIIDLQLQGFAYIRF
jgi:intracellular sulfur oxidation DsrE/DsrF family protein